MQRWRNKEEMYVNDQESLFNLGWLSFEGEVLEVTLLFNLQTYTESYKGE